MTASSIAAAKNNGPGDAPNQDQRGAPRKGQPDIGSYEFTRCKGVVVNFVGTTGKDNLKGGPGKDKLDGGPGKDKEVQ